MGALIARDAPVYMPRPWRPPHACRKWFGAVAQLGERLNGIQEVSGSIPLSSTTRALVTSAGTGPLPRSPAP